MHDACWAINKLPNFLGTNDNNDYGHFGGICDGHLEMEKAQEVASRGSVLVPFDRS